MHAEEYKEVVEERDVFQDLGCRNRKEKRKLAKQISKSKSFKKWKREEAKE